MARKYTILKVLTPNLTKGFTLIELIVGLVIFSIVSGLALNALVQSSQSFNQDKSTIDSSQNLSAVLEVIGNDVRQAGEQISDSSFPVITIEPNNDTGTYASSGVGPMSGSSKITIRRAVVPALTLCTPIAAGATTLPAKLTVLTVDTAAATTSSCINSTAPTTLSNRKSNGSIVTLPSALMAARNYRCQLDNPNTPLPDYSSTTVYNPPTLYATDICASTKPSTNDSETILAAMSDGSGNIRKFYYTDDNVTTTGTATTYSININTNNPNSTLPVSYTSTSVPAINAAYSAANAIYLIEERIYVLDSSNNLQVSSDGGKTYNVLISGIQSFNVAAKVYGDTTAQALDYIDPSVVGSTTTPVTVNNLAISRRCDASIPYYICEFDDANFNNSWKSLAGVKVSLQAKYDPRGKSATPTQTDLDKLTARAEYFPRNVLSK